MHTDVDCRHRDPTCASHAGLSVQTCDHCLNVSFTDSQGRVMPTVALARLFGDFDLVGGLAAVGAPGREVLMYRAPDRLANAALRVLEPHRWFRADENLWISHDGDHLLFSHDHPSVSHLVGA